MPNTFADNLLQFARTVDIVNTEIFDHAKSIVERYVKEALSVSYFEFMRETTVSGAQGLETVWATSQKHSDPIKSQDDNYTNQICFAFGECVPLWVVNGDKTPLSSSGNYLDLWSGRDSLPKYELPVEGHDFRTAIMIPMKKKSGGCLGVLDFESSEYIEITERAKRELSIISDALALLSEREIMIVNDTADTKIALRELEASFGSKYLLRLSKPKLFFAWPSNADPLVVAVIRRVLDEFSERVNIVSWDEIEDSGNINDQIIEHILNSTYSVCYFSERAGEAPNTFQDNANVLIEAGMLHVLSQSDQSLSEAWLPIREEEPPPIPFDFVAQRVLFVPRLKSGELDEKFFRERLKKRIEKLLINK